MNSEAIREISQLFKSRWNSHYVRSKLKTDPLYNAVHEELADSSLPLLDLGCGLGLLAFYLRKRGYDCPILGSDYDEKKILTAQEIAEEHFSDLKFQHGDAREGIPGFMGNVTILDILQFFDREQQSNLLRAAAKNVAAGGKLVIRTGLKDKSWRFRVTYLGDLLAKATFWMKAAPTCYPTQASLAKMLEGAGLKGSFKPLWGKTPFNNWLVVFERP